MIDGIIQRTTVPPVKMTGPGPSQADLRRMLAAAAAAPDHGKLVPWRYLIISGEGRSSLGDLFARGVIDARPDASPAEIEKQRSTPTRAPLVLIAIARVIENHPKIPAIEQIAAASASIENLLLAAHSLGYAAKWATGANAYSPTVKAGLGLDADEHILGILYVGTFAHPHLPPERPDIASFTRAWPDT
ncbi:MAG: nitroreductase [Geminicoccaceae bacterium]|nr:nitroreductase [Geminicoccaceae bacterium]